MDSIETYIRDLLDIHRSGQAVKETSYYGALANLLNAIGKTLKPRVQCIINLKNRGAGIPDGGLFTPDQLQRVAEDQRFISQLPARGVIEIKGTGDEVRKIAASEQVLRYLGRYGQVLVTNYRDFLLVGRSADGNPVHLESCRLAKNEQDFWDAAQHSRQMAEAHGAQFTEYLKRVLLYAAPLARPEDVAWFLASYARDAKARVEKIDLPALATVRAALEEALGIKFEGEKGEHFFRSTLVQTLFYGIFSAWVLWSKQQLTTTDGRPQGPPPHTASTPDPTIWGSNAVFSWRETNWSLHVPIIRALFEQVATPTKLGPLGLVEVLDWTGAALNRVDRAAFFARFEEEHAVQYFYEPFLEAFDPDLRKDLGVWYTPQEIVRYMVARVDTALREELAIEDGLADPCVYVLDPCCGTGTYLMEVLKRIAATLREKGEDALGGYDIKKAALERVFGFEILPAPFVVAHLQLGLLLQQLGAPLSDQKGERAGVYLTNALTGWEPPDPAKEKITQLRLAGMPELQEERDAAEQIKRSVPILVILGNPPYNAFAGVSPKEEQKLVDPYKEGLIAQWGIKKFNLDDLYIRFFRLAERRIAEQTGKGVVCYISNFSYLGDPSYVVMRQRFLKEFDRLWFDCLNGDSRETGKLTPEGKPDPSVFSTDYNREGIRVGTAIGLLVRQAQHQEQPVVRFRQFWGVTKRADLLASLENNDFDAQYESACPEQSNRFTFRPQDVASHYLGWPKLVELCKEVPISGLQEMRKGALMDIDRQALEDRMRMYYDASVDWNTIKNLSAGLTTDGGRFDAKATRTKLLTLENFHSEQVTRYALYPFDNRWCYYTSTRPLWNEPRPSLVAQHWQGNRYFIMRMVAERPNEQIPMTITSALPDYHLLRPNAVAIPLHLRYEPIKQTEQASLFLPDKSSGMIQVANLSEKSRAYLAALCIEDPDTDTNSVELIWMHALAIGYSPAYLGENADGIRQDWPRIPLPNTKELLLNSATLGRTLAGLLDTERVVSGVTAGKMRTELRSLGAIWRVDGGALNPDAGDLEVTAGWGHGGKDGVTMPGKGRIVPRDYTMDERTAIEQGAALLGLSLQEAIARLGETTCDIYLNNVACWKNIPRKIWNYHIGGYQVIKKWLSYRECELLGRALTVDEAREVTGMARRIAAIALLEPALDANYQAIKHAAYAWPGPIDRARVS